MKKRRRESRKARVNILLIGNQSFHLFLYPLIIFTFFKLSFIFRVFFPLYSIPSHLFLPSLDSRPPCTRVEWHLKINQDVKDWTKIVTCGAFKTYVGKSCRSKCAVSTEHIFVLKTSSLIAHSTNGGEHSPLAHISRPQEWSEVFETADTQFVNRNLCIK